MKRQQLMALLAAWLGIASMILAQEPEPFAPPDDFAPAPAPALPFVNMPSFGGITPNAATEMPEQETEPPDLFFFNASWMIWWFNSNHVPPLVTSGSMADSIPGAIGQPNTALLFGNSIEQNSFNGARLGLRRWYALDSFGWDVSGFIVGPRENKGTFIGSGSTVLARPFFNTVTGAEDADPVSVPDMIVGGIQTSLISSLTSAEINGLMNLYDSEVVRLDLVAGPRFAALYEKLQISESLNFLPTSYDSQSFLIDNFSTHNRFYGGQVGFEFSVNVPRVSFSIRNKTAVGYTDRIVKVDGIGVHGDPIITTGGLLTQPGNIGTSQQRKLSAINETGLRIGVRLISRLSLLVEYDFFYWGQVARVGPQVNRAIAIQTLQTPTPIGPPTPPVLNHAKDFYGNGLSVGLQYSF